MAAVTRVRPHHTRLSPQTGPRVLIRACPHRLHLSCYQVASRSIVLWLVLMSRRQQQIAALARKPRMELRDSGLDVMGGEYCCPLCSYLCNCVVPVAAAAAAASAPATSALSLAEWQAAVRSWIATAQQTAAPASPLSILQMRVGVLLWKHPLPSESCALLWDAVLN